MMNKNNFIQIGVFLLFVIFFYLFIKDCITNISYGDEEEKGSAFRMYYVIGSMVVSIFYLFFAKKWPKQKLDKTITTYILFIIVLTLLHAVITSPLKGLSSYFLIIAPLFVFLFVRLIVIALDKNKICVIASVGLFLALSVSYFTKYKQLSALEIEYHNIYSYVILLLLPVILCATDKKVRIIGVIITSLVILTSFKRGGLIAFLLGFVFFLRISYKERRNSRVWSFLIVMVLIIVMVRFDSRIGNTIIERLTNQEGDYSSGRYELYQMTIQMIADSSPLGIIFGHGYNAVLKDSVLHYAAHNDFLEIFYDYGLFGFIIFLIMCVQMIKRAVVLVKSNSPFAAAFTYAVIIFLVLSSVSTIIRIPVLSFSAFYTFGYLCGKTYEKG